MTAQAAVGATVLFGALVLVSLAGVGVSALAAAPCPPPPVKGSCRTHIAPICSLGASPICLCDDASDFSCHWVCARF